MTYLPYEMFYKIRRRIAYRLEGFSLDLKTVGVFIEVNLVAIIRQNKSE